MGGERVCGSADLPQNFIRILAKKLVQITDSKHNSTQTANLSMGDQARKVQKVDGFGTKTVQIGESCTPFHPNFFLLGLQEFFFQNLPTPLKNEMVPKTKVIKSWIDILLLHQIIKLLLLWAVPSSLLFLTNQCLWIAHSYHLYVEFGTQFFLCQILLFYFTWGSSFCIMSPNLNGISSANCHES